MTKSRVIEVIETKSVRGDGCCELSPKRKIRQYFSLKGELLAEDDAHEHNMANYGLAALTEEMQEAEAEAKLDAIAEHQSKSAIRSEQLRTRMLEVNKLKNELAAEREKSAKLEAELASFKAVKAADKPIKIPLTPAEKAVVLKSKVSKSK